MTSAKKTLEALFSDLQPKKTQIYEKLKTEAKKTQLTGGSSLQAPAKKCTKKKPDLKIHVAQNCMLHLVRSYVQFF